MHRYLFGIIGIREERLQPPLTVIEMQRHQRTSRMQMSGDLAANPTHKHCWLGTNTPKPRHWLPYQPF